jgi:TPP-dependent indolepyruvate ferredoxin oxidoreductase alpha subunit
MKFLEIYMKSKKIENEKATVKAMIELFCRDNHSRTSGLCPGCSMLMEYSHLKLEKCSLGENKPACSKCSIHCYNAANRKKVREVMRYSGPRMLCYHPALAIRYLYNKIRNDL